MVVDQILYLGGITCQQVKMKYKNVPTSGTCASSHRVLPRFDFVFHYTVNTVWPFDCAIVFYNAVHRSITHQYSRTGVKFYKVPVKVCVTLSGHIRSWMYD